MGRVPRERCGCPPLPPTPRGPQVLPSRCGVLEKSVMPCPPEPASSPGAVTLVARIPGDCLGRAAVEGFCANTQGLHPPLAFTFSHSAAASSLTCACLPFRVPSSWQGSSLASLLQPLFFGGGMDFEFKEV